MLKRTLQDLETMAWGTSPINSTADYTSSLSTFDIASRSAPFAMTSSAVRPQNRHSRSSQEVRLARMS